MAHAFDTLRFTQRLEQVGVGREQAIAHAELARDMILGEVASKDDIGNVREDVLDLKDDFKREFAGLRKDIGDLEARIGGSLRELDARLGGSIRELDTKVSGSVRELDARIAGSLRELELRMTIKLGAIVVAAMAAIAAVQKFL